MKQIFNCANKFLPVIYNSFEYKLENKHQKPQNLLCIYETCLIKNNYKIINKQIFLSFIKIVSQKIILKT